MISLWGEWMRPTWFSPFLHRWPLLIDEVFFLLGILWQRIVWEFWGFWGEHKRKELNIIVESNLRIIRICYCAWFTLIKILCRFILDPYASFNQFSIATQKKLSVSQRGISLNLFFIYFIRIFIEISSKLFKIEFSISMMHFTNFQKLYQ